MSQSEPGLGNNSGNSVRIPAAPPRGRAGRRALAWSDRSTAADSRQPGQLAQVEGCLPSRPGGGSITTGRFVVLAGAVQACGHLEDPELVEVGTRPVVLCCAVRRVGELPARLFLDERNQDWQRHFERRFCRHCSISACRVVPGMPGTARPATCNASASSRSPERVAVGRGAGLGFGFVGGVPTDSGGVRVEGGGDGLVVHVPWWRRCSK